MAVNGLKRLRRFALKRREPPNIFRRLGARLPPLGFPKENTALKPVSRQPLQRGCRLELQTEVDIDDVHALQRKSRRGADWPTPAVPRLESMRCPFEYSMLTLTASARA